MLFDVAIAVLLNEDGKILITQRARAKDHGGYFEFPGGKVEANELPEQALRRELKEELDLSILDAHFIDIVEHDYERYQVRLHVFLIRKFSGMIACCDGQTAMHWVALTALKNFSFPAANQKIIENLLASDIIPNQMSIR